MGAKVNVLGLCAILEHTLSNWAVHTGVVLNAVALIRLPATLWGIDGQVHGLVVVLKGLRSHAEMRLCVVIQVFEHVRGVAETQCLNAEIPWTLWNNVALVGCTLEGVRAAISGNSVGDMQRHAGVAGQRLTRHVEDPGEGAAVVFHPATLKGVLWEVLTTANDALVTRNISFHGPLANGKSVGGEVGVYPAGGGSHTDGAVHVIFVNKAVVGAACHFTFGFMSNAGTAGLTIGIYEVELATLLQAQQRCTVVIFGEFDGELIPRLHTTLGCRPVKFNFQPGPFV